MQSHSSLFHCECPSLCSFSLLLLSSGHYCAPSSKFPSPKPHLCKKFTNRNSGGRISLLPHSPAFQSIFLFPTASIGLSSTACTHSSTHLPISTISDGSLAFVCLSWPQHLLLTLIYFYLYWGACVPGYTFGSQRTDAGVDFLLQPNGTPRSNSDHFGWWQVPPIELSLSLLDSFVEY